MGSNQTTVNGKRKYRYKDPVDSTCPPLSGRKMQVIKTSCHTTCPQLSSPLNRLTAKLVVFYFY